LAALEDAFFVGGNANPVKGIVFTVNVLFVAVLSIGSTARLSKLNWLTSPQILIVESCASLKSGRLSCAASTDVAKRQNPKYAGPVPFASRVVIRMRHRG